MTNKNLSRRGEKKYTTNPFLDLALTNTKHGTKRITDKTGTKMMVVSNDGEILAPAGFCVLALLSESFKLVSVIIKYIFLYPIKLFNEKV